MGCDIHMYVEVKREGQWKTADKWSKNEYYDAGDQSNHEPEKVVAWADHFYHRRNYDLFAILADVRNGRGFAGCITGSGFNPIASPRGLPVDVSAEVKAESDRWNGDGHSHSWHTVADLLAYDWDQTTKHTGWVSDKEFLAYKANGRPNDWCAGVYGARIEHVTEVEMQKRIEAGTSGRCYCQVHWGETYRECADEFLTETMPRLQSLGAPEDVRIVFFFDN